MTVILRFDPVGVAVFENLLLTFDLRSKPFQYALSPLLFTIFFMVVIRAGRRGSTERGFETRKGFDDLNVVDRSLPKPQESWGKLREGLAWCQLEVNKEKSRILFFDKKKYSHQEKGMELSDDFKFTCGVKEGATFLGLDVIKCTSSKEVANLRFGQMKSWLEHISNLKYGLGAKMFFYEVGVLSRFRWWFTKWTMKPAFTEGSSNVLSAQRTTPNR